MDILNMENNISWKCSNHLHRYRQGLESHQLWAINMFESAGKFETGSIIDLGSFDKCMNIKNSVNESDIILGKYCIGRLTNSPYVYENISANDLVPHSKNMRIAICVPNSCAAQEMKDVYTHFGVEMVIDEDLCQTTASQSNIDGNAIGGICFFVVIASLMVASTIYDVALKYSKIESVHPILISFSIYTNSKNILAITNSPNHISCLDGIRVLSIFWIIWYHRLYERYYFLETLLIKTELYNGIDMIAVNGIFAVDTFFLMSGCVLSNNFIRTAQKDQKFNFIAYVVHRYLRLTPQLIALIIFLVTIEKHITSGPLWESKMEDYIQACRQSWWKNVLFIQNIETGHRTCMAHSWYISAEFQLYLLSPIVLLLQKRWPKLLMSVIGVLIICNIVGNFSIVWDIKTVSKKYYVQSYTRAAPWLIGLVLGYIIFISKQQNQKPTSKKKAFLITFLCTTSLTVCFVCALTGSEVLVGEYNRLRYSIYYSAIRVVWPLAVAWIIFACATGFGGPLNWFLSLPLFHVLAKLVYCVYLVHYIVIIAEISQRRTNDLYDISVAKVFEDIVVSFMIATLLYLGFEAPTPTIDKFITEKIRLRS